MSDTTTALLTEHFSYTPLSLIDDVINSVNNLIYQAISSLEDGLLSTPPERLGFSQVSHPGTIPDTDADGNVDYPEARLEIENGLHQLETLLETSVDKQFDRFEIYVLRNILTVPGDLLNWLRLGHYENLSFSSAQESDAPSPQSISLLRRKLQETRKLRRALKQENARNDAIITQLRSLLSTPEKSEAGVSIAQAIPNLSFLTTDPVAKQLNVGSDSRPLVTNTTFILSQLPTLRSMLAQLRPKLKTLPRSAEEIDINQKKNERSEYIDSRTRMHLERNGELRMGEGSAVLAGRKIHSSEAQALEAVIETLNESRT